MFPGGMRLPPTAHRTDGGQLLVRRTANELACSRVRARARAGPMARRRRRGGTARAYHILENETATRRHRGIESMNSELLGGTLSIYKLATFGIRIRTVRGGAAGKRGQIVYTKITYSACMNSFRIQRLDSFYAISHGIPVRPIYWLRTAARERTLIGVTISKFLSYKLVLKHIL
eukprot:COSAG02_NODE_112_length_35994_cov_12.152695_12_plen_175_part_00